MALKRWLRKWRSSCKTKQVPERRDHLSRLPAELLLLIFRSANEPALLTPLSKHLLPVAITMRQETLVVDARLFLEPIRVEALIRPRALVLKHAHVYLPSRGEFKRGNLTEDAAFKSLFDALRLAPCVTHLTLHTPSGMEPEVYDTEPIEPDGLNLRQYLGLDILEEVEFVVEKSVWRPFAWRKPIVGTLRGVDCTLRRQRRGIRE